MALPIQDSETSKCIKSCMNCTKACLEALHYLLNSKISGMQGRHISLLQLCAETCQLSSAMMIADLEFHNQSCELAFELTKACADVCEKYDDPVMVRCAEACRHCAETTRGMAGMTVSLRGEQKDFSRATTNGSSSARM